MSIDPPSDVAGLLDVAHEDVASGRYSEALQKFLRFHREALAHQPGLAGVRLSFALSYWAELGELYPPARQTMLDERDAAENVALAQDRPVRERTQAALATFAFNRMLGGEPDTVTLIRALVESAPEVAQGCRSAALRQVVAAGDLELAYRCLGDPEGVVRRGAEKLKSTAGMDDPQLDQAMTGFFQQDLDEVEAVLRAAGDAGRIPRIRQLALELTPDRFRPQMHAWAATRPA